MAKLAPTADFPRDDLCVRITQLESALDNMPQALCMFDAERRLILSNRLYADSSACRPS
jgi:PAS domain-containing protein